MTRIICSGLIHNNRACEKRGQCANYIHWLDDPRSVFNACASGFPADYKFFAAKNATPPTPPAAPQGRLF